MSAPAIRPARWSAWVRRTSNGLDLICTQVDINDRDAVRAEADRVGQFDAVIALGVIPHVEDDAVREAMSFFLKPEYHHLFSLQRNVLANGTASPRSSSLTTRWRQLRSSSRTRWLTTSISDSLWTSPRRGVGQGRPGLRRSHPLPQPVRTDAVAQQASSTCPSPGTTSIRRTR